MRIFTFFSFLSLSLGVFAQSDFNKQFQSIIKDTANGFLQFRGPQNNETDNTLGKHSISYSTIITVSGTRDNFINTTEYSINAGDTTTIVTYYYHMLIADSLKEGKAKKICDDWRDKISGLLIGGFVIRKYQPKDWSSTKYGWTLSKKELDISQDLLPLEKGSALNRVWLTIAYTSYKVR